MAQIIRQQVKKQGIKRNIGTFQKVNRYQVFSKLKLKMKKVKLIKQFVLNDKSEYFYQVESDLKSITILVKITINWEKNFITTKSYLCKNIQPINVKSSMINDLIKFLIKLNSIYATKLLSIFHLQLSGLIYTQSSLSLIFHSHIEAYITLHLKKEIQSIIFLWKILIIKVLPLVNIFSEQISTLINHFANKQFLREKIQIIRKYQELSFRDIGFYLKDYQYNERNVSSKCNSKFKSDISNLFSCHIGSETATTQEIMNQAQINQLNFFLKFPVPKKTNKKGQNSYISNKIYLRNSQQVKYKQVKEDARYKWYIMNLQFVYILSCNQLKEPNNFNHQNMKLQKWVFSRVAKTQQQQISLQNEKQILSLLRFASYSYFFKYYKCDLTKFVFSDVTLVDAYISENLKLYIEKNRRIMSFVTKLFILTQTIQALLALKQYEIIYTNLNYETIIVQKKGLKIKIIDFTQSYNNKVYQKMQLFGVKYKAIFPYSAPQIYSKQPLSFTHHMATFSFGVLIFQIVFNKTFFQNRQELIKSYKSLEYLDKFLFAIEDGDSIIYRDVYIILLNIIFRCIDPDPKKRPSPQWIIIILKKILSFYLSPSFDL